MVYFMTTTYNSDGMRSESFLPHFTPSFMRFSAVPSAPTNRSHHSTLIVTARRYILSDSQLSSIGFGSS